MSYRFVVNALTHCASLLGKIFGISKGIVNFVKKMSQ